MDVLAAKQWFGIFGLIFFFVFFLGVVVWVFRPGAAEKYRKWGHIPLDEDDGPDEIDR